MTFLNAALLLGALAFAVPLIIHILNRSRFQTVDWGAMHLLESVVKVNHRRFRVDQLILLLVRCLLPILLALCLARPVLTGFQMLRGDAPVSLVVLLDNSYSMETAEKNGTRYEEAVDAACAIIGGTTRGSDITVIQTGGAPLPLFDKPVFDADAVVRKLRQQKPGYGSTRVVDSMSAALATLAGMSHPSRELVVISDFQPADWDAIDETQQAAIRQQLAASTIEPSITFINVGRATDENVSADRLEIPSRILGVGQTLDVRAVLRNHGDSTVDRTRVVMRVDGEEAGVSTVSLAADGTAQTLFQHAFETPGSHVVEVEAMSDDPLAADNRSRIAVTIWDRVRVLLVDGDPSRKPLESETDFLAVALTPNTLGRTRLSDLIETETVSVKEFQKTKLLDTRVVVLANVSKLSNEQLKWLAEYVGNGGAMLVSAGDKLDLNWYRKQFFNGGQGLLPLPYGETRGLDDARRGRPARGTTAKIVAERFEHPSLAYFNDPTHGDLSSGDIRRWYAVDRSDLADENDRDFVIAARLDNGDPLLVERTFGDGTVMQLTTSIDTDWSNLPLRPVFVPLMQQITTTLAARISPPRNIATGEPAVALFDEDSAATVTIETPVGRRRTIDTVAENGRRVARYPSTRRPGVYTMSSTSDQSIHFVATTSRSESELGVLSSNDVKQLAEKIGGTRASSATEYLERDDRRRHGREIWKLLLLAFLGFMFLEVVLQQRFARSPS